jgi:hypothetical protein
MCDCDPLWKLCATNFPYYRCPKCGREYFSSGDAKVIDKFDLGTLADRVKQLDEKARELGLPTPSSLENKLGKIAKIVAVKEEDED